MVQKYAIILNHKPIVLNMYYIYEFNIYSIIFQSLLKLLILYILKLLLFNMNILFIYIHDRYNL